MLLIEGRVGAVVSTTTLKPAVALLVLPAASVAVTVKVCDPFVSSIRGVNQPTVITLHQRRTQQGASIIDADGAACLGGTVQRRARIVGQLSVVERRIEHAACDIIHH